MRAFRPQPFRIADWRREGRRQFTAKGRARYGRLPRRRTATRWRSGHKTARPVPMRTLPVPRRPALRARDDSTRIGSTSWKPLPPPRIVPQRHHHLPALPARRGLRSRRRGDSSDRRVLNRRSSSCPHSPRAPALSRRRENQHPSTELPLP